MTIENQSFEIPDGTPPQLVSTAVAPFTLADGDVIEIAVVADGGLSAVERYVADTADFADITAATSAEVAAALGTAMPTLTVTAPTGGTVVVAGPYNGARSALQVTSRGGFQDALQFPTDPAYGETYVGPPQGWTVTSACALWECAEFSSFNYGAPLEDFEQDWSHGAALLAAAPFVEDFEATWFTIVVGGSTSAALFNAGTQQFESFESSWVTLAPQVPLEYVTAPFSGPSYESFESSWDHLDVIASYFQGTFSLGIANYLTFENVSTATHVISVPDGATLGVYRMLINGTVYSYTASGADTYIEILLGIRADVMANTQMTPSVVTDQLTSGWFTLSPNIPRAGIVDVVSVEAPTGSDMQVVLATDSPYLSSYWVGQDLNPTL